MGLKLAMASPKGRSPSGESAHLVVASPPVGQGIDSVRCRWPGWAARTAAIRSGGREVFDEGGYPCGGLGRLFAEHPAHGEDRDTVLVAGQRHQGVAAWLGKTTTSCSRRMLAGMRSSWLVGQVDDDLVLEWSAVAEGLQEGRVREPRPVACTTTSACTVFAAPPSPCACPHAEAAFMHSGPYCLMSRCPRGLIRCLI